MPTRAARYEDLLFDTPSYLPPEEAAAAAASCPGAPGAELAHGKRGRIKRLRVYVGSYDQSLNLQTDESYALAVAAPTSTLQARALPAPAPEAARPARRAARPASSLRFTPMAAHRGARGRRPPCTARCAAWRPSRSWWTVWHARRAARRASGCPARPHRQHQTIPPPPAPASRPPGLPRAWKRRPRRPPERPGRRRWGVRQRMGRTRGGRVPWARVAAAACSCRPPSRGAGWLRPAGQGRRGKGGKRGRMQARPARTPASAVPVFARGCAFCRRVERRDAAQAAAGRLGGPGQTARPRVRARRAPPRAASGRGGQ